MDSQGIIIQARMGSSRLLGKMGKIFYHDLTLFEIVLKNIVDNCPADIRVVLATTTDSSDDILVEIALKYSVNIFRGNTNDVLTRITEAAKQYNIKTLLRICADNPFIDIENTLSLLDYLRKHELEYVGYRIYSGLPTIKTHWGLWGEAVSLAALEKVRSLTSEIKYREHVTNYIYEHPHEFRVNLLKVIPAAFHRKDIRLTIDTIDDFSMMQSLYTEYYSKFTYFSVEQLITYIDNNNSYLNIMSLAIKNNTK